MGNYGREGNGRSGGPGLRGDSRPAFSIITFKTYLIKIPHVWELFIYFFKHDISETRSGWKNSNLALECCRVDQVEKESS